MAQNLRKKGKILFDAVKPDFCWNIGPEISICDNDQNYRVLLKAVFRYDPEMHEYDIKRFAVFDK